MAEESPQDVARIEREAYEWMRRFSAGGRAADLEALKRWCARSPLHRDAFERMSRTWRNLGFIGDAFPGRDDVPAVPPRSQVSRRAVLGWGGAFAASAAAGLIASPPFGLWPSWSELSADYSTRPGERRWITLGDKTAIELNTRTSITVRRVNGQSGGFELITGEAMVQTPPKTGAPVIVFAGDGRIVATAARFNVCRLGPTVFVTCLDGEVEVSRAQTIHRIRADQQVSYSIQGIGPTVDIDPAVVTAWHNDLVIFRETRIADVIGEVNRYCPGKVILTNAALRDRRLNARFRIEDMDKVVGQIEQIFGARATRLPYGIVLLG